MEELTEFNFNTGKARQTIILFVGSSLILLALLATTDNKISASFLEYKEIFLILFLGYFFFILLLCKRLYDSYLNEPKISIGEKEISIPNFYLGKKRIFKKDIYSVEEISVKKNTVGAYIGVRNQGSFILDKERFKSSHEFQEVFYLLSLHAKDNNSSEKNTLLDELSRKQINNNVVFTYVFSCIAIIFYFVGTHGGVQYSGDIDFLVLGANTKDTVRSLELYRVASSTFLHISIFHLLLNLLVLGIFSQFLEKILAFERFSTLFLFSNSVAVLSSTFFSDFDASIGASGGIFGLWGAYAVLKIKYEDCLPGSINSIPAKRFYYVLVLELFIEIFLLKNVDYINHIGGFTAGYIYLNIIPLGPKLDAIDQPVMLEKILFGILALSYATGLSYFLLHYYN